MQSSILIIKVPLPLSDCQSVHSWPHFQNHEMQIAEQNVTRHKIQKGSKIKDKTTQ